MKILIVDRASAFSIWTQMNAVAREAMAEGHEVVYFILDDGAASAPPPPAGVRAHRIAVRPRRTIPDRIGQWVVFSRAFLRIVRAERPDVTHTNFCVPGVAARLIARLFGGSRVISTYHEMRGSLNPIYRAALAATDWTAARRVFVSAACARSFGAAAEPVNAPGQTPVARDLVVWNGVAAPAVAPPAPRAPDAPPRLVFAGRLMPEKGVDVLIAAAGLLRARGVAVALDIFGDGPIRPALEATGASGAVRFHGWADHAATLRAFAGADCVAIPSDGVQEGFGLTLAEALMTAPGVVASDIPVFREVAEGLGEGLGDGLEFFAPGDPAALADAVARLLAAPASPDRLAKRRNAATARFDIRRMARIYLELYRAAG